jgi:heptosyltransferase-1
MRVLIVKTSALGDLVHALPVLDYLHTVKPGIEIDWVAEAAFLPVVMHNPLISQVHTVRTKAWRKKPFSRETREQVRQLRDRLRERNYDLVFDLQGNFKSGLIDRITGVQEIVSFSGEAVQERINLLFTTRKVELRPIDRHVSERYLRVVSDYFGQEYAGMACKTDIPSAPEDEEKADRYLATLPDGPVFLLQVGTTWQSKLWFPEGWIELTGRIRSRYPDATILINWGAPEEKALGEEIVRAVGERVALLPWLSIKELIPVIRKVDIVIGGDTGPVYIAAAVGTPTVSFYRATDATRYAPLGDRHVAIQAAISCAGCLRTRCDKDEECRRSITVDQMYNAVVKIMG